MVSERDSEDPGGKCVSPGSLPPNQVYFPNPNFPLKKFLTEARPGGRGENGALATKSLSSALKLAGARHFPSDLTPPGNWPPSAFDSLAYLVIYWVHVKIKWVKILLFKQQGKGHQKGVHFISPVLIKSSMK